MRSVQALMRQLVQDGVFAASSPLHPRHRFLRRRYLMHKPQFIPQGAIKAAERDDVDALSPASIVSSLVDGLPRGSEQAEGSGVARIPPRTRRPADSRHARRDVTQSLPTRYSYWTVISKIRSITFIQRCARDSGIPFPDCAST